jgi:hypothetical protein
MKLVLTTHGNRSLNDPFSDSSYFHRQGGMSQQSDEATVADGIMKLQGAGIGGFVSSLRFACHDGLGAGVLRSPRFT